ncbi:MAG TPA: Fe-S cluster assembly ATPase SufC [Verrucomicrobiae bacterium]|nr:Fe-S cluster assembly ATPase SufC [Verrucomicrobiae bacterium]
MFSVKNLSVTVEGNAILREFSLSTEKGSVHALMGPNGSGKSTLAHALAGHPSYEVTGGEALLGDVNILELSPSERAQAGVFLAFQYPAAIPGVSVSHFLRLAVQSLQKARGETPVGVAPFIRELRERMKLLGIPLSFAERSVNDGFSGGEKKRLEMLQMLMLKPKVVILDEIDSGLDIDAMKFVAEAVHTLRTEQPETTVLVITHYQRLLNYIKPDYVHIVKEGAVVRSGGPELAHQLEAHGYEGIVRERA